MSNPTTTVQEIREARAKIIEPPWFTDHDDAHDCPDHSDSGLAMVDTGRSDGWPVARLCEWPTANFISNTPRYIDFLLSEVGRLGDEPRLGCATTRQLLDEIAARIEIHHSLDYRTVDPPMKYGLPDARIEEMDS